MFRVKAKAERQASVGRVVTELALAANPRTHATLARALADVTAAVRAATCECSVREELADGHIEVVRLAVAARADQSSSSPLASRGDD